MSDTAMSGAVVADAFAPTWKDEIAPYEPTVCYVCGGPLTVRHTRPYRSGGWETFHFDCAQCGVRRNYCAVRSCSMCGAYLPDRIDPPERMYCHWCIEKYDLRDGWETDWAAPWVKGGQRLGEGDAASIVRGGLIVWRAPGWSLQAIAEGRNYMATAMRDGEQAAHHLGLFPRETLIPDAMRALAGLQ